MRMSAMYVHLYVIHLMNKEDIRQSYIEMQEIKLKSA